jgi:triacylglycerol lipase
MRRRELRFALLLGALCALAWTPSATAQMPPEIIPQIKAMGRIVDPPKTAAIYGPLQEKEPYAGVKVLRDVQYGPDPRNVLDLFAPEAVRYEPRAVYVFVHGGGFVAGSKRNPPSPFYDNFMVWATNNGMVGVNIEYRLAPAHPWPAAIQDVASAVKWIRANVAQFGGDPERIFLVGSSAGGGLVGGYLADPKLWPDPKNVGVKGVLLLAGTYDYTFMPPAPLEPYLGKDRSKYEERSPLVGIVKSGVPLFLSWAELDPPEIVKQSEILYANLCSKNRCPKKVWLAHHSHMSTVYAVNTKDTQLADAMLDFVNTTK